MIPNTTQIPNVILDHWLGKLPGETLKVLLYIARRTFGFHAECASLRISQIASGLVIGDERKDNGTGLCERAVQGHLRVLIELGLVERIPQTRPDGGTAPSLYTINLQPEQEREQSFPPVHVGAPPPVHVGAPPRCTAVHPHKERKISERKLERESPHPQDERSVSRTGGEPHLRRLLAAYRSVMFPSAIADQFDEGEFDYARRHLEFLHSAGVDTTRLIAMTRRAASEIDHVTLRYIAGNVTYLSTPPKARGVARSPQERPNSARAANPSPQTPEAPLRGAQGPKQADASRCPNTDNRQPNTGRNDHEPTTIDPERLAAARARAASLQRRAS